MKKHSIAYITYDEFENSDDPKVVIEEFDSYEAAKSRAMELIDTTIVMEIGYDGEAIEFLWDDMFK